MNCQSFFILYYFFLIVIKGMLENRFCFDFCNVAVHNVTTSDQISTFIRFSLYIRLQTYVNTICVWRPRKTDKIISHKFNNCKSSSKLQRRLVPAGFYGTGSWIKWFHQNEEKSFNNNINLSSQLKNLMSQLN